MSVMQKSRRRKNEIEVIVIVDFCWHGNNFSTKNQDQVDSLHNVLYMCDHLNMLFNELIP